jgi:hypothetical protein
MSGYCEGCGNQECVCGAAEISMTDDYLSENYVNKRIIRKLVERWKDESTEEGIHFFIGITQWQCADELEAVLNKE